MTNHDGTNANDHADNVARLAAALSPTFGPTTSMREAIESALSKSEAVRLTNPNPTTCDACNDNVARGIVSVGDEMHDCADFDAPFDDDDNDGPRPYYLNESTDDGCLGLSEVVAAIAVNEATMHAAKVLARYNRWLESHGKQIATDDHGRTIWETRLSRAIAQMDGYVFAGIANDWRLLADDDARLMHYRPRIVAVDAPTSPFANGVAATTADPITNAVERGEYHGESYVSLAEMDAVGVS